MTTSCCRYNKSVYSLEPIIYIFNNLNHLLSKLNVASDLWKTFFEIDRVAQIFLLLNKLLTAFTNTLNPESTMQS